MGRKSKFCHKCGSEISIDAKFCPVCGARQLTFEVYDISEKGERRSVYIGIAAFMSGFFGVLEFIGGLGFLFFGSAALKIPVPLFNLLAGAMCYILAFPLVLFGILDLIAAFLLWDCKKSGGIIALISSILGIMIGLLWFPLSIIDIFANFIVILLVSAGWSTLK